MSAYDSLDGICEPSYVFYLNGDDDDVHHHIHLLLLLVLLLLLLFPILQKVDQYMIPLTFSFHDHLVNFLICFLILLLVPKVVLMITPPPLLVLLLDLVRLDFLLFLKCLFFVVPPFIDRMSCS